MAKIKNLFNHLKDSQVGFAIESSNIEIRGNREIRIEGCNRILSFSDDLIKISTKGMLVNFHGKNLTIKCMTSDSLLIQGLIINIEFVR